MSGALGGLSLSAAMPSVPDAYDLAPKVELHLHLEGAIPHAILWDWRPRYGGDPRVPDVEAMRRMLSYRDFSHFIEVWWWMTGWLRQADDFTTLATAVATGLVDQRIVYAEASISPSDFTRHGISPGEMALAVRAGLDTVPETTVQLIVDLVRDTGPERCAETLAQVLEVKDDAGIVGITIGGSEQGHPPGRFAEVYHRAAEAGLRLTAHAGEAAGPENVWGALVDLGVERIGHGVRSVEDHDLVAHLVAAQVPLEVCPTSNLRTGVAVDWETHPVATLMAAGANVTINSDDPSFFHCSLADELRQVSERFGDGPPTAERLTRAAVAASWLDVERAARLDEAVAGWWAAWRSHNPDPGRLAAL